MIVLSFLLVVIAAVTLLVGLFQDTLTWIWISIGACVVAMVFLGIGVLQRRSGRREPDEADGDAYGPGAISSLITGDEEQTPETGEAAASADDVSVVPKRSVSDARGEISRAEVEEAADEAVAEAEAKARAGEGTEAPASAKKSASKKTAKKTSKKAASRKKTAKKTTGKAARERLDAVKGLGPAKQKALLAEFGSLEAIRDADPADLRQVKGIGETTAKEIRKQLS